MQGEQFVRYELAGQSFAGLVDEARRLLGVPKERTSTGSSTAIRRGTCIARPGSLADRLAGCIYFDRPRRLARTRLAGAHVLTRRSSMRQRARSLMAGRALEGVGPGRAVCSCFGVGRNPIAACARELGAAATPAEIGKRLKCGTNCGSCVPEIQAIIGEVAKKSA